MAHNNSYISIDTSIYLRKNNTIIIIIILLLLNIYNTRAKQRNNPVRYVFKTFCTKDDFKKMSLPKTI